MKYEVVMFDLDGTVLDTAVGVYKSHRFAAKKLGLAYPDSENEHILMGPGLTETAVNYYKMDDEHAPEFVEAFREYYDKTGISEAHLYDNIPEIFDFLREKGVKTAICTMKDEKQAELCMQLFSIEGKTDFVCGISDAAPSEKWQTIERILELSGVSDRKKALLVGDSPTDAAGAARAGVDFAAALYGHGFTAKTVCDTQSVFVAKSTKELLRWLKTVI